VGTGPLTYQWRKDGSALGSPGTVASLTLTNVQVADVGAYSVVVSNAFGTAVSRDANLSVLPGGFSATHATVGRGYVAGGTVKISTTITYTGTLTALAYQMLLPAGWSYLAGAGSEGDIRPIVGEVDLLEWAWTSVPASPVTFTVTLRVPAGTTGAHAVTGLVSTRPGPIQFVPQPDPLVLNPTTTHSADSNQDFRIGLIELTRVVELFNTRYGATRTGAYKVDPTTEDGFTIDQTRSGAAVLSLYHSADTNADGRISLVELTRVIELYNTRSGTTRTGAYHVQAGSEDGFEPGP
jgi:hypothetical protein